MKPQISANRMTRRRCLQGTLAAAAALLAGCSRSDPGARRSIVYASAFSLAKSMDETLWLEFERRIESELPQFDVRLLIRGETGPEEQAFAGARRGRLQIAGGSFAGVATIVPEIALLSAPFLFDSEAEVDFVMDRYMLPPFRVLFAAKGLELIHWTDVGWVNLYGKEPMRVPEAARGRRIRASTSIASQAFIRELGADTITMPFSDIVPSLQTGLIEGGVTSTTMYALSGISTEAPNYVLTRHTYDMGVLLASSKWLRALTPAQRASFMVGFGGAQNARRRVREYVSGKLAQLPAQGVRLYEPTAAERERWRRAAWPAHEKLIARIGGSARQIYDALLQGKRDFSASGSLATRAAG